MPSRLREVTQEFARGDSTLEALRLAAREEIRDRVIADQVLLLISDWENSTAEKSAWSRNELRESAGKLVPAPLPPPPEKKDYTKNMYDTGLRGQRRRGATPGDRP